MGFHPKEPLTCQRRSSVPKGLALASGPSRTPAFRRSSMPAVTGVKRVRQRLVYFGKIADDPDGAAALEKWLDEKDDLLAGCTPRVANDDLTVRNLCNRFLTAKRSQLSSGELAACTFADDYRTCELLVAASGKNRLVADLAADDFERLRSAFAKTRGPVAVGHQTQRTRVIFAFAHDAGPIDHPVRYGPMCKRPSRKVLRKERAKRGPRTFETRHIRRLVKGAGAQVQAMGFAGRLANAIARRVLLTAVSRGPTWMRSASVPVRPSESARTSVASRTQTSSSWRPTQLAAYGRCVKPPTRPRSLRAHVLCRSPRPSHGTEVRHMG
jgi:hypothetical protein